MFTKIRQNLDISTPFIGGALAVLAFAPYRIAWFAIIATTLLYRSWHNATPKQAFFHGWLFGLGIFGFGLSWINVVVHDHGAMPLALAWFITGTFISLLSLLFAAQGYVLVRYADLSSKLGAFVLFPLSMVVFETVRSTLFTGLPWLLLGVSQTNGPLGGLLPYIGIGGTSFVVAFCGVSLFYMMQQIGSLSKARVLALLTLLGLHYLTPIVPLWGLIAFFLYNILFLRNEITWAFTLLVGIYLTAGIAAHTEFTQAEKSLTVSMVQVNVPNRLKWDPRETSKLVQRYLTLSEPLWHSDVVIWPEGAIPQLKDELPNLITEMKEKAIKHDTTLILGLPSFDYDNGRYHNSLFVIGKREGEYHKRHLVPFGEYVPFQEYIRGVFSFLDLPMSVLAPGPKKQTPLHMQDVAFAPFICFETAYSGYLAKALPEAKVLVALSDDSWFGHSNAGQQHLQIAQALAATGGRSLLHSTNTGMTAIIDYRGQVQKIIPPHQQGVLTGVVQTRSGLTPWAWLNQYPIWDWLAVITFLFGLSYPHRNAIQHQFSACNKRRASQNQRNLGKGA